VDFHQRRPVLIGDIKMITVSRRWYISLSMKTRERCGCIGCYGLHLTSRDSSVGIATGYGLDGRGSISGRCRYLRHFCRLSGFFLSFPDVRGNSYIRFPFRKLIYTRYNLWCLAMNNVALQFTLNRRHLKSGHIFFNVSQLGSVNNTSLIVHSCNATNSHTPLCSNIGMPILPYPRCMQKQEARKNECSCT
jgi:hypothetical protein